MTLSDSLLEKCTSARSSKLHLGDCFVAEGGGMRWQLLPSVAGKNLLKIKSDIWVESEKK